ncbi:S53 family peptidase [Streptomyces sp. YU58]|uniref:S53 family peptidase n=1 Tax=Streptomyces sp. SX92 TaxID=3158972 RepID=UPI0027BADF73|nr:S53 family peptidase [Streptomyces coralus]WLW53453.1 S53 family peptidase [Streptomyces coralus]
MTKRVHAATGRSRPAAGKVRTRVGAVVAATVAVALGVASAGTAAAAGPSAASGTDGPKRIGTAPRVPAGGAVVGATASGTTLHLGVTLAPRDPRALADFVTAVSTPGDPLYHHYLAKGRFAAAFGPTRATVADVSRALRAAGLAPGRVSPDGLSLPVTATVAQASHAFGTRFENVRLKDGTIGRLNTAAPALPAAVAASVTGIVGLSDLGTLTGHHTAARHVGEPAPVTGRAPRTVAPRTYTPGLCADFTGSGLSDGTDYYSPGKLAGTYGMASSATAGAGQTVAVFELENVDAAAIAAYQSCAGTAASVSHVYVDTTQGAGAPAGSTVDGQPVGVESALDIEDLIGLVPGASIVDYQGVDATSATDQNVLDVYRKMVTDDQAQVISTSWGICEPVESGATATAENTIFAEAAAQGQSIVAASGDSGSSDCEPATGSSAAAVDDPASQPYVTGVGGTTMTGSGSTATQKAWNSDGGASGGGVSTRWQPTVFQGGIATTAKRAVPDVAALADPSTGYPIYFTDGSQGSGPLPGIIGGTSGAAPTWAAAVVQANAAAACQTNGRVGFLNDALYRAGRANYPGGFWDVTSGTNSVFATGFTAVTGYDQVTGLGAPREAGLTSALCAAKGTAATGASTFHPLASPQRVLDTRNGTGWGLSSHPTTKPLVTGGTAPVKIEGVAGIPGSGVTAVVLNLTVTGTTGAGSLTAWADGTTKPSTSALNWTGSGQTIAASTTVKVAGDGVVDLATNSATHLIADVQGYYTSDTGGAGYTALKPARLLDTRNATGISTTTKITDKAISLKVRGRGGVPSGATSVVLNLTATQTVGGGYLEAYPEGATRPTASNVNWSATGTTIPNLAVVPIGSDGNVSVFVRGTSHVIADVSGYFAPTGATFETVTPQRLLDTRKTTALGSGRTLALQIAGADAIPATGVEAVVLTVTVTGTTGTGYLTAWADGTSRPTASNLNWVAGKTISNQVIVPVGSDGKVDFYTSSTTQVIADVTGYLG